MFLGTFYTLTLLTTLLYGLQISLATILLNIYISSATWRMIKMFSSSTNIFWFDLLPPHQVKQMLIKNEAILSDHNTERVDIQ